MKIQFTQHCANENSKKGIKGTGVYLTAYPTGNLKGAVQFGYIFRTTLRDKWAFGLDALKSIVAIHINIVKLKNIGVL
jgi:hypothetical protein